MDLLIHLPGLETNFLKYKQRPGALAREQFVFVL